MKADQNQTVTLQTLRNLTQSDRCWQICRGLLRLLRTDTNTRTLANPQLRTSEGIPRRRASASGCRFRSRRLLPIATGGAPQQPITSFNYENIGVNIDITPRTHHDDDVSLALKQVTVQSISGTGFGGLPTFGNREISTVITLHDGETNMLAGLIRDDERRVLDGIPGLIDLPVLGRLFARSRTQTDQTDIILTLTPHIVRVLDLNEADLRAFRSCRDTLSPAELPFAAEPLPLPEPPPAAPDSPPVAAPDTLPRIR